MDGYERIRWAAIEMRCSEVTSRRADRPWVFGAQWRFSIGFRSCLASIQSVIIEVEELLSVFVGLMFSSLHH